MNPQMHSDRFTRPPIQTHNRRLCHIVSDSAAKALPSLNHQSSPSSAPPMRNRSLSVQCSKSSSQEKQDLASLRLANGSQKKTKDEDVGQTEQRWPPPSNSPYYGENVSIESNPGTSKQVGNQLLQRVIRLQAELQRRDTEIAQLRDNIAFPPTSGGRAKRHMITHREALPRAHTENGDQKVYEENDTNQEEEKPKTANSKIDFTGLICDTFFKVCFEELNVLNSRFSNSSARDYADIFLETVKALQEPFSFRLMEINTKCSTTFESVKLGQADRDQLYMQFDKFLKENIYPISKAFDAFLPILKDSASIARESVRACNVFSQWSREFGDQLQLQPSWELMAFKADDLKTRFSEWSMSKHWLPPSLLPLLKILIYEHKNQLEEQKRKDAEYLNEKSKADIKIAELEELLESSNAKLQEIVYQKREPEDYEEVKVKNVELQQTVEKLQEQIDQLSLSGKISLSSTLDTIIPKEEYTEVPEIYLQKSLEAEKRPSLGKVSGIASEVIAQIDQSEQAGNDFEGNEDSDSSNASTFSSKRADFTVEYPPESNRVTNEESKLPSGPSSPTMHENQQRNKRDISAEDWPSQVASPNLVNSELVDSKKVDGVIQLENGGLAEQERASSTHSKESMQAREEFYKDFQLGTQALSFVDSAIEGMAEEEEDEEVQSSAHSELNTSVEDSELPESRPLSQVQSGSDTPRPAPDQIDDIDSATPQDDDFYHKLELHSSEDEHVTEKNFEQIKQTYNELENRRKREECTNLTTTKPDLLESVNHSGIHSQVSQSSVETVKEMIPEDWESMGCKENEYRILSPGNSAPLESADNSKDESVDRTEVQTPMVSTPPTQKSASPKSPSPSSHILDNEDMGDGKLSENEEKSNECLIRNTENVYENGFMLPQPPNNSKMISQHHNNAIQFWHLASLLARMLRVDIPTHNSPDSLEHSLSMQSWEEEKSVNYQEIELRQTAVNTIIEKLELLLDNLRSSAGVNGLADSEDSGHCNSSSTTDGSKHELGQTTI